MNARLSTCCVVLAAAAVAVAGVALAAQTPTAPPVYTAAQADAGYMIYRGYCENCHQPNLGGLNDAPPLAGPAFMTAWRTHKVSELLNQAMTMPPDGGGISDEQYLQLVAYILQRNGAAAGDQPLTAATSAVVGDVATGVAPPPRD